MQERRSDPRARARDDGVLRLRRTTRFSILGATALAGVFAGAAAHSNPGHKAPAAAAKRRVANATALQQAPATVETPAAPPPAAAAPPPAATAPPPVATTAPPVAATGAT